MTRYYAGIGSRETPADVLALMTQIAQELRTKGYTLRSGGAPGADSAFARGARKESITYIPWNGFNNLYVRAERPTIIACGDDPQLHAIAERFHPAWHHCGRGARALHTRNVAQILGDKPFPVPTYNEFVVCWTPNGLTKGGTGQALRIADAYELPIYNLADPSTYDALRRNRLS